VQVDEDRPPATGAARDRGPRDELYAAVVAERLARSRQMRARRQRIVRARLVLARGLMRL
jgi:hypothetical protein